jgi:hypothetical protein
MKFLRSLLDFYIQSSLHVAFSVMALALLSVLQLGFVPEPSLLLTIFFATICGYNFVKYSGISNRHHLEITNNILLIRTFTAFCFAGFVYFGRLQPVNLWYTFGIFALLTGLYTIPVFKEKNLRSLRGIKVLIIALVWMGFTVAIPLQYHHTLFTERGLFQCIEILLLVIVLMIPFEIRDLKYDQPELSTIPQIFGIQNTKWLGTVLLVIIAIIVQQQNYIYDAYLYANLGILLVVLLLVWLSNENQGKYYASLLVESVPVIWLVGYLFV